MLGEVFKVRDLMTARIVTIGMDDTLRTAQRIFSRHKFHHLVVVESGKPVGVLSDRDLLKNISPFVGALLSELPRDSATLRRRVHQMMTRKLVSIGPDCEISLAAQRMMDEHVSCLPVIDNDDKVVGIITIHDLLRWLVKRRLADMDPA